MTERDTLAAAVSREARTRGNPSVIAALLYYRLAVILIVAGSLTIGALGSFFLIGSPAAEAQFGVTDPRGNSVLRSGVTSESSFQTYAQQRAVQVGSDPVLRRAVEELAAKGITMTIDSLRSATTTDVDKDSAVISVHVTATTADSAVAAVNAVVSSFKAESISQLRARADRELDAIKQARTRLATSGKDVASTQASAEALTQLELRATDVEVDVQSFGDGINFVDDARAIPVSKPRTIARGALMGAAAGLLLSLILAFALADQVPTQRRNRLQPQFLPI
ncbi:MAG: hypothetical protein U0Q15_14205 [Kineosporiaceae bacterium]